MPLLAMNFGHPIWILNRRGSLESLRRASGAQRPSFECDPGLNSLTLSDYSAEQALELAATAAEPLVSLRPLTQLMSSLASYSELSERLRVTCDRSFWNYSYDQQASGDLPQVVDYVLEREDPSDKLILFGHSAGAALQLMALSERPELTDRSE